MGRHKVVESTDEERSKLYDLYIKPNHAYVRNTVARLTSKKSEIDDNFQDMCTLLLRNVDTYNPSMLPRNWIITCCRRSVGKLEAKKDSYVDATKGGEFEYSTYHEEDIPRNDRSSYKNKWRPKKAKNFVNVYDDSVFKSNPNEMLHEGVDEDMIKILQDISPNTDFGTGSYMDILDGVLESNDIDISIHFMMHFHNEKVKDIAYNLNMKASEVRNALSRAETRIENVLKTL